MKGNNEIIAIDHNILIWARSRLKLDLNEVAHKLKTNPSVISSWENGKSRPSLSQLDTLAYEIYKIPLATFFLPEPPEEPLIEQQFRTIPDSEISKLPYKFMVLVKEAQYYQEVLKEIFDGKNPVLQPIFKSNTHFKGDSPHDTANLIREKLAINKEKQAKFKDSTDAFKYYRNALEINGVFVFQQTLKKFCRGYSLFDTEFPIIIVNSSEATDTGKNFTLFHELGHLLHSMGGISNDYTYQSTNRIEVTCNKLASLVLVDNDELLQELEANNIDADNINDNQLQLLAKEFKVSQEVVLRKLIDLNMASQQYYSEKRKQWLASVPKTTKSKGGNHFNIKLSKLGHNYSSLVLKNMYNGKISRYQASEFLSTKINYIPKLEKLIFR
jgi:Zn-dependent peptidase ImmA (M78 family)/transcriptional regulator with XRE-family HTH domain